MSKKTFNIEVSVETMEKRLRKVFLGGKEPHSELISRMIINNLCETEVGVKQVFLAFLGVEETIPFMIGDEVLADTSYMPSWRWDKNKMQELIVNKKLKAKVIGLHPHKTANIHINYKYFKEGEVDLQEDNCFLEARHITLDSKGTIARPDISEIL